MNSLRFDVTLDGTLPVELSLREPSTCCRDQFCGISTR